MLQIAEDTSGSIPEERTIPLGGVDAAGRPLPPTGTFYVPGDKKAVSGSTPAIGNFDPYSEPETKTEAKSGAIGNFEPYTGAETEPKLPKRVIGAGEAALTGVGQALTFGTAPAIAGLSAASGEPGRKLSEQEVPSEAAGGAGVLKPIMGGINLLKQYFSEHPNEEVKAAYEQGRKDYEEFQKEAQKQQPGAYIGGQVAGAAATLPFTGAKAAAGAIPVASRIWQGAKTGGIGGTLFGGGEAIGEGGSALDVAKGAAGGGLAGLALGGLFGSTLEGGKSIAKKVASIRRGARDAEAEAGSRVASSLFADRPQVQSAIRDKAAAVAGHEAGTPVRIVDVGGENTRALLRSAANQSPTARNIIVEKISSRYRQQSERFSNFIRSKFSGRDSEAELEALKAAAAKANDPAYAVAYRAGARMPFTKELQQLAGAPSIQKAIAGAVAPMKDRGIVAGYKLPRSNPFAVNPKTGAMTLRVNEKGNTVLPELAFWDQIVRNLSGRIGELQRAGNNTRARDLIMLKNQLTAELDNLVPQYKQARAGAHQFFKAEDALEAGANFVKDNAISTTAGARAFADMTSAEQELFRRGFANELADQIAKSGRKSNVLDSMFIDSERASQRIRVALGEQGAKEFEALVRMETLVDRARTALGNSTTARQFKELGLSGPVGVWGTLESLKGAIDPTYFIAGALVVGAKHTARHIDDQIAVKIAEMLMSKDPAVLARGYKIISENPTLQAALRGATDVSVREIINYARPSGVAAAAGTAYTGIRGKKESATKAIQGDYGDDYNQGTAQPVH